jgi:cytochrome P450
MTEVPEAPPRRPEIALDIHGEEFCRRNYAIYDELRETTPLTWSTEIGGFWLFTDYESVFEATRDDDLFSSANGAGIREPSLDAGILDVIPPIHTDPPETAKLRQLTVKQLSPGAIKRLEPEIRAICDDLIDGFIERGECDIIGELTTPLPARVILKMLNFDESRWPEWITYIHTLIHGAEGGADPAEVQQKVREAIGSELGRRAALNTPADDMVGSILGATIDGRELTPQEKFGYVLLLLFGGMDTTSGLTGNTLVQLARHPELKQQLIDDPDLHGKATEEFLRHGSPTQGLARTVTRDTEFHGQQLREGDRVMLLWASANRDPKAFGCPADLKLDRSPNRHMAFGVGQHRCLGSNLARTMFQVMLTEILRRLPDFTMVDDEPLRFSDAANVYAPRELRIRFTPGPKVVS